MESVYDKILKSRPNTFVVFGQSGPKDVGFSPIPFSASGNAYGYGHFLPGGLSGYSYGSGGGLLFNGKFCSDPRDGGQGSIEMIRMREYGYSTGQGEFVFHIPNFMTLMKSDVANGETEMVLAVYNQEVLRFEVPTGPGVEHIVLNVDGLRVSVVVNGVVHHSVIPEEEEFTGSSSILTLSQNCRLWGVVVRPGSVSDEYCQEIAELINSFPAPAEAEFPFNPTTFVYDSTLVNDALVFRLEDLTYPEAPEEGLMFNGSTMEDIDTDYTDGWLNIPETEELSKVIIEKSLVAPVIIGSGFEPPEEVEIDMEEEDAEALPPQSSIDGYEDYAIIADHADDIVQVHRLRQDEIGSPERVLIFHPDPIGNDQIERSMTLRFLPEEVSIDSTSSPDRRMIIGDGTFIGQPSLFRGGFAGQSTILPDAEATDPEEYPNAYGGWFYLAKGSAQTLLSNGSFIISVNATNGLTMTGVTQMKVDGSTYTSGNLTDGWHHLAFIPSFKSNAPINVSQAGGKAIVYSFSLFYETSPADYIGKVYNNFVNPPSVSPTTPDNLSISDAGVKIYSHDWSISSAD